MFEISSSFKDTIVSEARQYSTDRQRFVLVGELERMRS